ncbi:5648_t:CDS:1, partial [Gigaspora rosea]
AFNNVTSHTFIRNNDENENANLPEETNFQENEPVDTLHERLSDASDSLGQENMIMQAVSPLF